MDSTRRLMVGHPVDVEVARRLARALALEYGFGTSEVDELVVAVSELATNLLRYARDGSLTLSIIRHGDRCGFRVESRDSGPGIDSLDLALQDGYSTGGGLGSGLPIVRRLMDDLRIESSPAGTMIVADKWKTALSG